MHFQLQRLCFALSLAVLPVVSAGCASLPQQGAVCESGSSQLVHTDDTQAFEVTTAPEPNDIQSAVQIVAYSDNDVDDSADNSPAEFVEPAVPVEAEALATGEAGLTLEAVEQLALANNPAIQQASAEAARANGIRRQVSLKPNPSVGYNAAQLADEQTDQHTLYMQQTFVRGDKLDWNRRVLDHDVDAMNWQIEAQRQRVLTDIRLTFFSALAAQNRLVLAREFRGVAEKGVSVSEARVNAKVGARPDVLQSEIQLNEVDLSIQQAEFDLSAALNELSALAGVADLGETLVVGQLDVGFRQRDAESEFARISAASPQVAAAQARVERARSNLQRHCAQPISNVTGQLGAGYDRATGSGLINLTVSLPVPVHNRNQGNIQAAHAEYCAATQDVERIRLSIRRDLASVMREYQISEATVRRYRDSILPKADETLKLIQEAQNAGEFNFLRVLTARRTYFDANLRYVTAKGRLAQANAKLDGLLLTGGLADVVSYGGDDGLRGQALSGQ